MSESPDPSPGFYYVTMRDPENHSKVALLAGPFQDNHAKAIATVREASEKAIDLNQWYHFMSFGTVRSSTNLGPGKLNRLLQVSPCP